MSETTDQQTDLLARLAGMLSGQTMPQPGAQALGLPAPMPAQGYGLPAPQPMMAGAMPQPTGILVPIRFPLPDGSTLRMYVQFPAGDIQRTAQAAGQMFGQFLDAYQPRQNWGNGGGQRNSYGRRW